MVEMNKPKVAIPFGCGVTRELTQPALEGADRPLGREIGPMSKFTSIPRQIATMSQDLYS